VAIDLFVGATEQADLRTWRTLPAQIQLARLRLPAAHYLIEVTSTDGLFKEPWQSVTLEEGKATIVVVKDLR
jgi:hypothetical protein